MKKKIIVYGMFIGLWSNIAGCNSKPTLSIDTMKKIVWELNCVDQIQKNSFVADSFPAIKKDSLYLYEAVFRANKTSSQEFYSSFSYYESKPNLLKTLLDSSLAYGNRAKDSIYKKLYTNPANATNKDSLK